MLKRVSPAVAGEFIRRWEGRTAPWLRRQDLGFLVVLVICLLAIWPFISRPSLPQQTDAELHIFRLAELSRLARAGLFYPRWAPTFYYGYGYPIFNYYAPLVYYLGLPIDLMPGLGVVHAVKLVFVLGLLAAGVGMYGFVRDNWGRPAGWVAAAAYVYAPYVQMIDPHARGDLAESFSLGLLPLALWSLDRLRRAPSPGRWLAAVLLVAAVILCHNLMALVFFALLLAWAIWRRGGATLRRLALFGVASPLMALALGVGVAAFFWLPVALEQDAVNLTNVVGQGGHFDFRNHFLGLGELFGPSRLMDWGASEPAFALNLGVAQWLLGGLGLVAWLGGRAQQPLHTAFFVVTAIVLLLMMTPLATPVWEGVPLLPYLQFPWRLLGATNAMLAVLGGIGAAAVGDWIHRRDAGDFRFWILDFGRGHVFGDVVVAGLVALPMVLGLPLTQVAPWPADFGDTTIAGYARMELQGRWLGTTSTADFVPATVDAPPRPQEAVVAELLAGRPPDRVNRATLPAGTTVTAEMVNPLHFRYHVSGGEWFLLRLFLFAFPGWRARIDGQAVETELGLPEGFVVVPVPAGRHVVDVTFGGTAARRLAWTVTLVSISLMVMGAFGLVGKGKPLADSKPAGGRGRGWQVVLAVALAITVVHVVALEPLGVVRLESAGNVALPAERDVYVDFGRQIALIGLDGPAGPVAAGERMAVTLYWKAQTDLEINYQVFVHLLRPDGSLVAGAQSDKLNPGEFPTRRWTVDKYVRDEHWLALPPELPPGEYVVTAGLWVQAEGWRLPVLDGQGQQMDDKVVLGRLSVTP